MHGCPIVLLCALPFIMCLEPQLIEIDNEENRDIPEINKGLELFEGDIMTEVKTKTRFARNAVLASPKTTWDIPVPYVLHDTLNLNTKGAILLAFERFRLKSCLDFRPRRSEEFYLLIRENVGCYSFISRLIKNGQVVSIGRGCSATAIVQHEILHALGLYHEHSRPDRDDHITVLWKNIRHVYRSNFQKHMNSASLLGPYDYLSVMHYGSTAFSKNMENTIVTKVPESQDKIGQRIEMSPVDMYKLNRLYNCTSSTSFMDYCDFSRADTCGMSSCNKGLTKGWKRVSSAAGGPDTDSTSLNSTKGYFMHAGTASTTEGDSARLETKRMTPTRECRVQCLQFYFYHSGSNTDRLNIWIRVFQDSSDSTGDLRLMDQITGEPTFEWRFHRVSLDADKTFQVVFEVRSGNTSSLGGFSVDDINLSQTECPHHVWQIRNFEWLLTNMDYDTLLLSPRVYSPDGYAFQMYLILRESFFGAGFRLVSGDNDSLVDWPCAWRQVTITMLDQKPHVQQQMSYQISLTTDPSKENLFGNPRSVGRLISRNGEYLHANPAYGYKIFPLTLEKMRDKSFLKGGNAVFFFSMRDISSLQDENSLPCPNRPRTFPTYQDTSNMGPCDSQNKHAN